MPMDKTLTVKASALTLASKLLGLSNKLSETAHFRFDGVDITEAITETVKKLSKITKEYGHAENI